MEVIKTMSAGAPGTRRYTEEWREQLIAVRYRKDIPQQRIVTTIEIIVDQRPLQGNSRPPNEIIGKELQIVHIRVDYAEKDLRKKVKAAGGIWVPRLGAWALPYGDVKLLGLIDRLL